MPLETCAQTLARALDAGLNVVDTAPLYEDGYLDRRCEAEILPPARARGVGTVCFKTFGAGKLLGDTEGYSRPLSARPRGKVSSGGSEAEAATLPRLSVEECVRYTLTLDPDVALLGLSFPNEQDAAFAAAAAHPTPSGRSWVRKHLKSRSPLPEQPSPSRACSASRAAPAGARPRPRR